jgi:MarR family transcriptional regulator for hemolysin
MDSKPLRERVGVDLARTARLWRTKLDERLAPLGLTQARWITLLHLSKAASGIPQRALAEQIGVEGPTLVRVLDGLERMALIRRSDTPGDRRAKTVHLTPAAAPMLAEISRLATELREEILFGIDEDDLTVCQRVFEQISRNIAGRIGHRHPLGDQEHDRHRID